MRGFKNSIQHSFFTKGSSKGNLNLCGQLLFLNLHKLSGQFDEAKPILQAN
jgi:hypothetical protein